MLYLLIILSTGLSWILCTAGFLMELVVEVSSSLYGKDNEQLFKLTKPSSGMTCLVSGRGTLAMAPSGLGRPLDVRQLISASFSLIYEQVKRRCVFRQGIIRRIRLCLTTYDSEFGVSLVDLVPN